MNTRILRMCRRSDIKGQICYHVPALGQLQPVLFSHAGKKRFTFRAEDVAERHGEMQSCISVLDFRYHKPLIRKLFAELESYLANGTESPAAKWWREHQERRAAPSSAASAATASALVIELDLFGDPIQTDNRRKAGRR